MRSTTIVHIVSCHAEGEVGNVIVGGVSLPPGDSIWEQSRWIDNDQTLRQFVLNEPRGGVFKHVNLLVPSKNKKAAFGFIIMEPEHTPPMSGSNSICVATVLLDSGLIQMSEPETTFFLEAPAGLVHVKAFCEHGKAKSIEIQNVPSFADKLGVKTDRHPFVMQGFYFSTQYVIDRQVVEVFFYYLPVQVKTRVCWIGVSLQPKGYGP